MHAFFNKTYKNIYLDALVSDISFLILSKCNCR